MSYNRWAFSERLKCFASDNAGKIAIVILVIILAPQFPDQSKSIIREVWAVVIAFFNLIVEKKEFLSGVGVTVALNYAKDNIRLWQEVRAMGRALRQEVGGLGFRARFHIEDIKKYDDTECDYEEKLDNLRFRLKMKSEYIMPGRLFYGTDYMPFFKSGIQKIALLRVRFLVQGDDVVRLSSQINQFVIEYDSVYGRLEEKYRQVTEALSEEKDVFKGKDLARSYWIARDEYLRDVGHFADNCRALADVLRKY